MTRCWLILAYLISTILLKAQQDSIAEIELLFPSSEKVELINEVFVLPKITFKDEDDQKRFLFLRKKVYKVWPYVLQTQQLYHQNNQSLEKFDKKRKKKHHTKQLQDSLEHQYKEKLKKFSRTDARVMMKLMYRQIGKTTYDLVKEQRNGWTAFWWNTKASFFKLSMKDTLDIKHNRDDYFIEYIVQDGLNKGLLSTD